MPSRLFLAALLGIVLAACGGDTSSTVDTGAPATQPADSSSDTASDPDAGDEDDSGTDLGALGAPPDAQPMTAVAVVDGETYTFDAAVLGSARCEVSEESIAVNIGQSEDWFTFVATPAGNTWSTGPMFGLEDGLQYEGLPADGEIVVNGGTVTFRGEIVVKPDATDFDSWERTLGSVTVNCEGG